MFRRSLLARCTAFSLVFLASLPARADSVHPHENDSVEDLARASQNPVSAMISLPFQNNLNVLEGGSMLNTLLIQPVIPIKLNADWNLVTRTIMPVLAFSSPMPGLDRWALGDIQQSFFLSPEAPSAGGMIWGLGPILEYPSASEDAYGSGKWSAGPSFVGLKMSGPWVYGALANNIWSFAGDSDRRSVSRLTLQPFVNYNFDGGWFLQSSPLVTANWLADSGQKWTVPVGGGVGRTFRIGKQPLTMILTNFYNVERPDNGLRWNIRFQVTLMFPK